MAKYNAIYEDRLPHSIPKKATSISTVPAQVIEGSHLMLSIPD